MKKARLVIVRHGETDYNVKRIMTGQRDIPLNATGEEQARAAGGMIRDIRFDKVYSSSLRRAFNTAVIMLETAGTQAHLCGADGAFLIEKRQDLVEMDNGDYTGRCKDEPDVAARLAASDTVPWPGGESVEDVVARVQKFYDEELMPRLLRGENVLVAAHHVVLRAFEIVLGVEKPGMRRTVPNAVPAVCEYEDGVMTGFAYAAPTEMRANQNAVPGRKAASQRKGNQGPGM